MALCLGCSIICFCCAVVALTLIGNYNLSSCSVPLRRFNVTHISRHAYSASFMIENNTQVCYFTHKTRNTVPHTIYLKNTPEQGVLRCCVEREGDYMLGVITIVFDVVFMCSGLVAVVAWVIDSCYRNEFPQPRVGIRMQATQEFHLDHHETINLGVWDNGDKVVVVIQPSTSGRDER